MDQMIRTMKNASTGFDLQDRRDVLIHGQYIRKDQIDEFRDLNVIASFFPLHTFYWGDWHKQLIGDSLGNAISPTRTALDKGLKDYYPYGCARSTSNLMRVIWTASKRISRSGEIIGEMKD